MTNVDDTLKDLQAFFDSKIKAHGATPKGVDWKDESAQNARFAQVAKILPAPSEAFTLIDYGCGYGALSQYLHDNGYVNMTYIGYDMTASVIDSAKVAYAHLPNATFTTEENTLPTVDYVIGCGLFSMKLDTPLDVWQTHMHTTIKRMWSLAQKGLSFNSLTSYSDPEYMRPELYYPNPMDIFDFCKRTLSRNVALLHDYELYDFTVLVRR